MQTKQSKTRWIIAINGKINVWKCELIFPTDTLQKNIQITDLKPFLAGENCALHTQYSPRKGQTQIERCAGRCLTFYVKHTYLICSLSLYVRSLSLSVLCWWLNEGRSATQESGSVSDHRGSVISSPNCLFLAWGRLPRQPFPQQLSPLGGRISGNIVCERKAGVLDNTVLSTQRGKQRED